VPPLFRDQCVAILAGGPGLTPAVTAALRGNCRVLAISDAYLLAPWCDVHYFCDKKWFHWHQNGEAASQRCAGWTNKTAVEAFKGLKAIRVTLENSVAVRDEHLPTLHVVGNQGMGRNLKGLSPDPHLIRTGRNSGYQAIGLAAHMRPRTILLCGYNMKATSDKDAHWFGQHPQRTNPSSFVNSMLPFFASLVPDLAALGIEVINTTPDSALDCFPKMDLAEALGKLRRNADRLFDPP
jgi:hypothetical protein